MSGYRVDGVFYEGLPDDEPPMGQVTPRPVMNISRDWRTGLVEFAVIGYDYGAPNSARWVVTTGRTASGKRMERTDEAMTILSTHHFATDTEASAWCRTNGYR